MVTLVELGQATLQRRQDMGLTQAALARLSGLSRATVNQLEAARAQAHPTAGLARLGGPPATEH